MTRSGGEEAHGSGALFLRDQRWQALPSILDREPGLDPPFDRQQVSASMGGPLGRRGVFGFGALEVRNQDGGVLVGTRNPAARSITRTFAPAPLDDLLFAVTLRSGRPDRDLVIPDADNVHVAGFVQDDWQVRPQLTLNRGRENERARRGPRALQLGARVSF